MDASSTTLLVVQEILQVQFHSRKLLQYEPTAAPSNEGDNNSFDANVVMVLSVLICALICCLGLNSIIRCALRCSSFAASDHGNSIDSSKANTGIKKEALKTFPVINYTADLKLPGLDSECVICLSEFSTGERVKVLPKCNHGFHVKCIDRWLNSHSSCPTCRHCLIETCQKIVGYTIPAIPPPQQEIVVISIVPLQPEGLIRIYET